MYLFIENNCKKVAYSPDNKVIDISIKETNKLFYYSNEHNVLRQDFTIDNNEFSYCKSFESFALYFLIVDAFKCVCVSLSLKMSSNASLILHIIHN